MDNTINPAVTAAHKTFVGRLLQSIAHLPEEIVTDVEGIFNAASAAWHKLEPEVQADLAHGSGVLAIINSNLQAAPSEVIAAIQKVFPDLNITNLENGLVKVGQGLQIVSSATASPDLETVVGNFQTYLSTKSGSVWATVAKGAASLLSEAFTVFSGGSVPAIQVIEELVQYAYEAIVKPKVLAEA